MLEKILGKRKSIQRSLMRSFIISISMVIIITLIGFFIFVVPSMNTKLIEFNINSKEDIEAVLYIVQSFLGLTIVNIILISAILIRINTKKMLQPIKQLNEATKKVASRKL